MAETKKKVHLLDYVAGNIRSLVNAVEKCGYEVEWIKSPEDVKNAEVRKLLFLYRPNARTCPEMVDYSVLFRYSYIAFRFCHWFYTKYIRGWRSPSWLSTMGSILNNTEESFTICLSTSLTPEMSPIETHPPRRRPLLALPRLSLHCQLPPRHSLTYRLWQTLLRHLRGSAGSLLRLGRGA